jgi:cell division septum initiation protein DivIVA
MEQQIVKARLIIPIRERDNQFMHLQEMIEAKKNMLLEKQKKLRFIARQNAFLDAVKNDYENYYGYIVQQKNDQIKALRVLDEYIRQLTISGNLTKHNIEDAKQEQFKILRELNSIKENLDSIIEDTSEIVDNRNN